MVRLGPSPIEAATDDGAGGVVFLLAFLKNLVKRRLAVRAESRSISSLSEDVPHARNTFGQLQSSRVELRQCQENLIGPA